MSNSLHFAKNILGTGFFPCRKQASATTLHAGCDPVVEPFLGWKDEPSRTWNHTEV